MDVFSMELGIRLSFVKTAEFKGGFEPPKTLSPSLGKPQTLGHLEVAMYSLCHTFFLVVYDCVTIAQVTL
jgi:hypothetical protein